MYGTIMRSRVLTACDRRSFSLRLPMPTGRAASSATVSASHRRWKCFKSGTHLRREFLRQTACLPSMHLQASHQGRGPAGQEQAAGRLKLPAMTCLRRGMAC